MSKKVVIVGAGFSGVLTAQYLDKNMRDKSDVEITLIDKNDYHTMRTEIHAIATGRGKPHNITYDLKKIFKKYKSVKVVKDEALDFDFDKKKVVCKNDSYKYDYLVISAGSQPHDFGIPGVKENALPFWTWDDAMQLKDKLEETFKTAAKSSDEMQKKLLTFHIIGAGLTGVELAGEIAEYADLHCPKYGIDRSNAAIFCVDAMDSAIPNLPSHLGARVQSILEELGVKFCFNTKVKKVEKDVITLETNGVESTVSTGLVIWSAGITANDVTAKAAEKLESMRGNRLVLDKYLRSVDDKHVYVCGDNMYYIPNKKNSPVAQMVENCEQASKIVANNIAHDIADIGKRKVYKPSLHGCMISLGGKKGVSYAGIEGLFMITLPSVITQIAKRFINIVYLAPVIGITPINLATLINREFLAKRK